MSVLLIAVLLQVVSADSILAGQVERSPELQARIRANPELLEPARWAEALETTPEWPRAAWEASLEGDATLICVVKVDGTAKVCEIAEETPEGSGFGAAAMTAQHLFRWIPAQFDGVPVESTVRFTMPFRFGEVVKGDPDTRAVIQAIGADGFAVGYCRSYTDPDILRRWDDLAQQMTERPTAEYRPYDHIFIDGYRKAGEQIAEHGDPTFPECARIRAWSADANQRAIPAFRKLDARIPPKSRQDYRPID